MKILTTMIKRRSPLTVLFAEDPEDNYIIHISEVRTSTGQVTDETMIIRPDLQTFINSYKRRNFFIKTENVL